MDLLLLYYNAYIYTYNDNNPKQFPENPCGWDLVHA